MKRLILFVFLLSAALWGFWTGKKPAVKREKTVLLETVHPGRDAPLVEYHSFAVVITAYNEGHWCERALRSVFEQDYDYCRVIFIDDGSTDGTSEIAQKFVLDNQQEHRVILMRNETRQGPVACLYRAVDSCLDREIVIPLTGKEWLAHPTVMSRQNLLFQNPDVWISFGQKISYPAYELQNPPVFEEKETDFGIYDLSLPCSFYSGLFKQLRLQDLFQQGRFARNKESYLVPMLELAGGRARSLSEPMAFSCIYPKGEEAFLQEQYHPLAAFPKTREGNEKADVLIFSYNRPLQLYACLESLERYLSGYERISVLYRASDATFDAAYEKVREAFPRVRFATQAKESDFKPHLLKLLFDSPSKFIVFGVDDLIVKDFADLKVCMEMLERTGAYGFYLRFGKHINRSYQAAKTQATPPSIPLSHNVFAWDLETAESDWAFPNSLDLTLYRKADLKTAFEKMKYKDPHALAFSWTKEFAPKRAVGLYFEQSKIVNLPLNAVGKTGNPHMNFLTPEELLLKFNQGLKIDIEPLYKVENASPHYEYVPEFINR